MTKRRLLRSRERTGGAIRNQALSGDAPRVALLVETARSFGRDFLSGIARYARLNGPWIFHIAPGDYRHKLPNMRQWGGTGIIARIHDQQIADAILKAGIPTIAVGLTDEQMRPGSPLANLPEVSSDAWQVAQLAAKHFLDKRLRNFAYVGVEGRPWSSRRGEAFAEILQTCGHKLHVYEQPKRFGRRHWEKELELMAKWLATLPTPLGLFACNDDRGRQVLEACRYCDLKIPEDVAVLGVDNDAVFCELADPPLSSVALNAEMAGYRAAELLDGMMSGRIREPQNSKVVVEALHVVTRRSTDLIAVEDDDVAAALQFIRQEQGRSLTVDDVVQAVAVSRRNLERRFKREIGRTVLEEIQLVRLERAKRLLIETTHPISKVAELTGFGSVAYFIQFFQDRVGTTPRRYRIQLTT